MWHPNIGIYFFFTFKSFFTSLKSLCTEVLQRSCAFLELLSVTTSLWQSGRGLSFVSGHLFVAECVMPDTNVDALDVHRHNLPGPPWVPSWGRTKGTQRLGRVRTTQTQKGFPKQTSGIFLLLLWPIPCWCLRVLLPSRRAGAQSWTSCFDRPRFPGGFVQSHPRLQTPPSLLIPCNSYISRLYLSLHFQTHIFPPGCLTRASHLTGPKLSSWLIPLSHLLLPQSLPIQKITTTRLA